MRWCCAALLLLCGKSDALIASAPRGLRAAATVMPPRRAACTMQDASFDVSAQQFDLLSLRTFRRDTILQYDATNQSEPLRIALCFFGVLFSLSAPVLFGDAYDTATVDIGAVIGTGISGLLFMRNRNARAARMGKIDLEYSMGDLRVRYRGVRVNALAELRKKRRVVACVGPRAVVDGAVAEARVYRRRLSGADCVVVPVYTDANSDVSASAAISGEAESRWLWEAAQPDDWRAYFNTLLGARGMAAGSALEGGAWLGLNLRGRSFGSAIGTPRWDELLGTALQPTGDGFGDLKEVATDIEAAVAEAALAASAIGGGGDAAAEEARGLLAAQAAFYDALTGKDVSAMEALWAGAPADPSVSEAIGEGGRVEPWAAGSPAFPPSGMRATDRDALVTAPTEAWTTAIERPAEGGTLLATQRWRRVGDEWLLATHRYIPWSADGATAVATLRCDGRGCVLLGREINTRDRRGAVL